ncbi:MAG TPA: PDZ domain-containing protein [Longimicrobium sp.]|nr:PDZ domain-containing protein [Longimicrobium sp.]
MRLPLFLLAVLLPLTAAAQQTAAPAPVAYVLTVDSADLSGWAVEMRIPDAPETMRLVMAAHPEYDDAFRRFVRDFTAESRGGAAEVVREDSAVWRVRSPGGEVTVRYRVGVPPGEEGFRGAWVPFLTPTGGLTGGPHAFMYVLGREQAPARVELRLPPGWDVATALPRDGSARRFAAPDVATLLDSPVLIGNLRRWRFEEGGVPHHVAYWPLPDAVPFDTAALVEALHGIVREGREMFRGLPYGEYFFLMVDGAYGGLEHASSTTLGAPSTELAGDWSEFLLSAAHEYFHVWNLMRLRPANWGGLTHLPPARTRELWWSEGVTMYYADLLLRRAGLVQTSRLEALAADLERYLDSPAITAVSPEEAGWISEAGGAAGDLGDHYLQGELAGTVLDLVIRDSTGGARTLDDVMRAMLAAHPPGRGYTGGDIERTAGQVCGCDLSAFFTRHIRGAQPLDFAPAMRRLGLAPRVRMQPVVDAQGRPQADLRVWPVESPGGNPPRLIVADPRSAWARAGLRTGDLVASINGTAVDSRRAFFTAARALRVGDRVRVEAVRDGQPVTAEFVMEGYEERKLAFEDLPSVTPQQRAARARWLAAAP